MKITFNVQFGIDPDWNSDLFLDGGAGRKRVISNSLRRAVMTAVARDGSQVMLQNGATVFWMAVSEPVFDGGEEVPREEEGEKE